MPEYSIRETTDADAPQLLQINNAAAPAVPVNTQDEFRGLTALSGLAIVVDDGAPAGFLLGMEPSADYDSENFRWFRTRSDSFVYVDRIVLAPRAQSAGLGRRLYERMFAWGRELGVAEVCCEVNVEPPNPRSLAFHARLGFAEVGRQATKGGSVHVALLAASIASF